MRRRASPGGPARAALLLLSVLASAPLLVLPAGAAASSPPGVLLWAHGRHGTSALTENAIYAARSQYGLELRACKHQKESFVRFVHAPLRTDPQTGPTKAKMRACVAEASELGVDAWFAHVKPWHLRGHLDIKTPDDLFKQARAVGVKKVVTVYRFNSVEAAASMAELSNTHSNARSRADFEDLMLKRWRRFAEYPRLRVENHCKGIAAAAKYGYDPLELEFPDSVGCDAAKRVAEAVRDAVGHGSGGNSTSTCKMSTAQSGISHLNRTLDWRVGNKAAQVIRDALVGTPQEWMLNTSASYPPGPRPQGCEQKETAYERCLCKYLM